MEKQITETLVKHSNSLFGVEIDQKLIQFQKTRKDVEGDLTLVIFPFVKILKCSPVEAGEKIGALLQQEIEHIEKFEVVSGFLNLVIASTFWIDQLSMMNQEELFGYSDANSKPTIMVEYSSPNTNKPLHLSHLRNIFGFLKKIFLN